MERVWFATTGTRTRTITVQAGQDHPFPRTTLVASDRHAPHSFVGVNPFSPGQFRFQACSAPWNGVHPRVRTPFQAFLSGLQRHTSEDQTDEFEAFAPVVTGQLQSVRERRVNPVLTQSGRRETNGRRKLRNRIRTSPEAGGRSCRQDSDVYERYHWVTCISWPTSMSPDPS